jgi:hypothetical protein
MKELISKIVSSIKKNSVPHDEFVDPISNSVIKITVDNLKRIEDYVVDSGNTLKKVLFIDGGNSSIIETGSYLVSYVKIAGIIYEQQKVVSKHIFNFFVYVDNQDSENVRVYSNAEIPFLNSLYTLNVKRGDLNLVEKVNEFRKQAEFKLGNYLSEKAEVIVFDGEGTEIKTKTSLGISKSCSLLTRNKKGVIDSLNELHTKLDMWRFGNDRLSFVKLNQNSHHIFRLDTYSGNIDAIVSLLSFYSTDPVFLGYPYGLIKADQEARVSNEEKSILRVMFNSMINLEKTEVSTNAHSKLDSVSF